MSSGETYSVGTTDAGDRPLYESQSNIKPEPPRPTGNQPLRTTLTKMDSLMTTAKDIDMTSSMRDSTVVQDQHKMDAMKRRSPSISGAPLKHHKISSSSSGSTAGRVAESAAYRARPVRSCTHCRQQKIKCNALDTFPAPCTRCAKMDRKCIIDPSFRPQKGGQVQLLRADISSLKQQLAALQGKPTDSPDSAVDSVSPTHSAFDQASSPETQRAKFTSGMFSY